MTDRQAKAIAIDKCQYMEVLGMFIPAVQGLIAEGNKMYLVRRSDDHRIGPLTSIRVSGLSEKAVVVGLIDFWGKPKEEMFYFPDYRLNLGDPYRNVELSA